MNNLSHQHLIDAYHVEIPFNLQNQFSSPEDDFFYMLLEKRRCYGIEFIINNKSYINILVNLINSLIKKGFYITIDKKYTTSDYEIHDDAISALRNNRLDYIYEKLSRNNFLKIISNTITLKASNSDGQYSLKNFNPKDFSKEIVKLSVFFNSITIDIEELSENNYDTFKNILKESIQKEINSIEIIESILFRRKIKNINSFFKDLFFEKQAFKGLDFERYVDDIKILSKNIEFFVVNKYILNMYQNILLEEMAKWVKKNDINNTLINRLNESIEKKMIIKIYVNNYFEHLLLSSPETLDSENISSILNLTTDLSFINQYTDYAEDMSLNNHKLLMKILLKHDCLQYRENDNKNILNKEIRNTLDKVIFLNWLIKNISMEQSTLRIIRKFGEYYKNNKYINIINPLKFWAIIEYSNDFNNEPISLNSIHTIFDIIISYLERNNFIEIVNKEKPDGNIYLKMKEKLIVDGIDPVDYINNIFIKTLLDNSLQNKLNIPRENITYFEAYLRGEIINYNLYVKDLLEKNEKTIKTKKEKI